MEFIVDKKVTDLGLKIKAVIIENIDNESLENDYLSWREERVSKLIDKYQDYDIKSDLVIEGFYKLHEKVLVPRRKNIPAVENLIKLLIKRKSLTSINKVVDIYNIISMNYKLCLGAHDIDKIKGDVTLKITDGSEVFKPLGSEEEKKVKKGEYAFVDSDNDVICWLDIRQVDKTKVTNSSKNILYFIIGNEETSYELLESAAQEILTLTTKFCKGQGKIIC